MVCWERAARGLVLGTNEVLAASVRGGAPSWSGARAYSRLLREKLVIMHKRGRLFTVYQLYKEIMKHSGPTSGQDKQALISTPDHAFAGGMGNRSIRLSELPTAHGISKAASESTSKTQRVFMEIELDSEEKPDTESWKRWFAQRVLPPSMLNFKFHTEEGMYMKTITENAVLARREG